jgi:hypothetical protein
MLIFLILNIKHHLRKNDKTKDKISSRSFNIVLSKA